MSTNMLENNNNVNKNVAIKGWIINNGTDFFSRNFLIFITLSDEIWRDYLLRNFSSVKEERRVIEIASVVAGMRFLWCTLWLCSLDWTSRRRRRGILITSFVSLESLHSLMRTSGQKRELIEEPREKRETRGGNGEARYFQNKKTSLRPHHFRNIDAQRGIQECSIMLFKWKYASLSKFRITSNTPKINLLFTRHTKRIFKITFHLL